MCVCVFFLLERRKAEVEGAGSKIFERTFVAVVFVDVLRMYVELSAALKNFENFLFHFCRLRCRRRCRCHLPQCRAAIQPGALLKIGTLRYEDGTV